MYLISDEEARRLGLDNPRHRVIYVLTAEDVAGTYAEMVEGSEHPDGYDSNAFWNLSPDQRDRLFYHAEKAVEGFMSGGYDWTEVIRDALFEAGVKAKAEDDATF